MPKKSSRYPCFRPQDSVSVTSSLSPSHTLASEACEETENKGSQRTKSRFSSSSSSSSSDQQKHHRDKRAFFWNTALVRLRNSFRSGNKISSDSSLPPRQKNPSSSAQENAACVRLSTTTSVEEDFVWQKIFGWQSDIIYAVHWSVKYKVSNGDKSRPSAHGPIRDQYSGHVICLDKSGTGLSW